MRPHRGPDLVETGSLTNAILRKRGLFRHDYAGTTLRDHYGLGRPASVFSNAIQAIA